MASLKVAVLLALLVLSSACNRVMAPPLTPIPTFTPILPTPTTQCAWMRNPGPPPPEVKQHALAAFAASGIQGDLRVQANGEYYCAEYHVQDIEFEFYLLAPDVRDLAALQATNALVQALAKDSLQGWNLGQIRIHYASGSEECWWNDLSNACDPIWPLPTP
jgi:hypothetical protein